MKEKVFDKKCGLERGRHSFYGKMRGKVFVKKKVSEWVDTHFMER